VYGGSALSNPTVINNGVTNAGAEVLGFTKTNEIDLSA
jgi:hypothetical protein